MWSRAPWEMPITDIKKKHNKVWKGTIISFLSKNSDTEKIISMQKKNKKREYCLLILYKFI